MKLVCIRGYPGQGKTQFALTAFPGAFHVENDMWHVRNGKYCFDAKTQAKAVSWCFDTCERALAEGMDVVVSNTLTKTKYVAAYGELAAKYGAEFAVYRMRGDFGDIHCVPESVIEGMKSNFQDWPGEIDVYPNVNQDPSDPCYRPYMMTELKTGDRIAVGSSDGIGETAEERTATVTDIRQGTYDYLNVYYTEDGTGRCGMCLSGDCVKLKKA